MDLQMSEAHLQVQEKRDLFRDNARASLSSVTDLSTVQTVSTETSAVSL